MSTKSPTCHACRTPLTFGAVEGFCPRCIGAMILEDATPAEARREAAPRELRPGQFGEYELFEEVGRGGMGVVFRAWQTRLQREVAVKLLLQGPFADHRSVQRFHTEAAAAARLHHPNIVAIHEIGAHEGRHFFSMDFVSGKNLVQILRSDGAIAARRVARIVGKISRAVHHAHQQGVLHRDLKPSNVLIDADDEPRVTDFGLAKRLFGDSELTVTGQVLGSPNYIPPEQAEARHELVGVRSDVYSIGAMLYHLLAGRPPFGGDNVAATLHQVLTREPPALRSIVRSVPADLETICLKCLEKDPSRRYASAQDVAEELERFLRDEPIHARPARRFERAWRWCRRRPVLAGLGAVSLLLFVGIAAVSTLAAVRSAETLEGREASLYASDMNAVQQAWSQNNLVRARALLEAHRPKPGEKDRRGFEWHLFHEWCQNRRYLTLLTQTNGFVDLAIDGPGDHVAVLDRQRLRVVTLADKRVIRSWELPTNNPSHAIAFLGNGSIVVRSATSGLILHEWNTGQERALVLGAGESLAVSEEGDALGFFGPPAVGFTRRDLTPLKVIEFGETNRPSGHDRGADRRREWLDVPIPEGIERWTGSDRARIWAGSAPPGGPRSAGRAETLTVPLGSERAVEAHWGGSLILREVRTGRILWSVAGLPRQPGQLAVHIQDPSHGLLAHAGPDQLIHLRNLQDGNEVAHFEGHAGPITRIQFHPAGSSLFSCGEDGRLIAWETFLTVPQPPGVTIVDATSARNSPGTPIPRPLWSPDRRFLTLTVPNNRPAAFGVYQRANLVKLTTLPGKPVSFSPDGRLLLVDLEADGFRFVKVPGWTRERGFRLPVGTGNLDHQLSPDGRFLAAADPDDQLIVFEAATGRALATNNTAVTQFEFSRDSHALIVGSANRVSLWDFRRGTQRPFLGERGDAFDLSTDGREVAVGTAAQSIRVIDLSSGRVRAALSGHHGTILALAYSPDGRTLVSSGEDRTVRFWNLSTMREAAEFPRESAVRLLQFDAEGSRLVLGTDNDYQLWSVSRDRPSPAASTATSRSLTGTIWSRAVELARQFPQ